MIDSDFAGVVNRLTVEEVLVYKTFAFSFKMAQLWKLVFLFFCGFHFFPSNAKNCSNFYFSRQLGRRFRCSIYKTLTCINVADCYEICASELKCFSVNFYQNEKETNVCELIKGTRSSLEEEECFEWKRGSEYDELLDTGSCSSSASCKAGKPRKALPGNWYQLGSSAFKLFEQKKNNTEAAAVCSANGGALATINSDEENKFINELYLAEQVSKRDLLIKDTLKPHKRWKLDGSDKDVTLHGSLVAKKDEYNNSAALYFTGTAGSYATTPAWGISTMTFSIALWVKLESMPPILWHLYSYWFNPFIFSIMIRNHGELMFEVRKKSNEQLFFGVGGRAVLNKWTHIVHVWNRQTKQATGYQDGTKIYETTPLTTSDLDFGVPIRSVLDVGYKRDVGLVMRGWLRELLVFDRAVTEEEVSIIRDATLLDPRVWIGPPQSYQNTAPVSQQNTNCFSARVWGTYQWEKIPCDRKLIFICKKTGLTSCLESELEGLV